jgi:outer membrane lipoprotein SlyB
MSTRISRANAPRGARSTLFLSSALAAAVAAAALTACGPRDENALAGGAGAVPSQATNTQAPTTSSATTAQAAPLQGQPVPSAQPPVYAPAPPVTVAAAGPTGSYAPAPQYAPAVTPTYPADPPRYQPAPAVRSSVPPAQAVPSYSVGAVESIEPITQRPQGSGAGAVIGGVLGAVVGNQFGHGLGRAAMTGVGAAGGAVAGNNVERNYKKGVVGYRVNVRLDNGRMRTFQRTSIGSLHVGDRVRLDASSFHRV